MIGLFQRWLARFVQLGLDLAAALIRGILGAPATAVKRLKTPVTVRLATADEVVDLRHRVLRDGRPRQDAIWDGDRAADTRHWVAEHDGRIVGVASVMGKVGEDGPAWQLRGMAVAPEWQGHGVGQALLQRIDADVAAPMWCNARQSALAFYRAAGWKETSELFDVPGIGLHRRMTRTLP